MSIEAMDQSLLLETPLSGDEIQDEAIEPKSTGAKFKPNAKKDFVHPNM
jgi:hypothetical protein